MVDDAKYQAEVTRLADLGIKTWAQTHGPIYEGAHIDRAIELLRAVPSAPACRNRVRTISTRSRRDRRLGTARRLRPVSLRRALP